MLKSLKFVQGSIAKKDFLPALTHFVVEFGKVRGFNGVIALCSPIPFDIACRPKADTLIKAIANCDDTVQLNLTPGGKLSVKAGKFRALINCVDMDNTAHPLPEGQFVQLDGAALLAGLKAVEPFIGNDASRKWANGVLIRDQCLFATNNVMLVQYWVGQMFDCVVNLPAVAVKEMLRINEPPLYAQVAEGNVTFHYEGDRWLRTQLYDTDSWPDLGKILDRASVQKPIQEELFPALEVVKPFVDVHGTVIFGDNGITTHPDENEGAAFEIPGFNGIEGKYNIAHLELLKGTAKTIDWSAYPAPCMFMNDRLRGAIVGLRK